MKFSPLLSMAAVTTAWLVGACRAEPLSSHNTTVDKQALLGRRSLATILQQVPACAISCIEQVADGPACADVICLCSNASIEKTLAACVSSACTTVEGVATKSYTQSACALPRRDRATPFNVTSITLCTITGIMVLARLVFKVCHSYVSKLGPYDAFIVVIAVGKFSLDDALIIVSIAVGLPCTILNGVGLTRHGLGKDVWTLAPGMVETFGRFFYVQQILYLFLVTTIKMSLLFFYLSIFPGSGVRIALWLTMVVTVMLGLMFILLSVFQCTPIEFYWQRYIQPMEGHCMRVNLLGWLHGGVNVAINVWMIGIPLFQIRKIRLHWKKKVGAAIMFLTGAFVTVVSALRLKSLVYFANSTNPTWDEWPVALWSTIEINVGLMCVCLPTLRLILGRMWPRAFGSTLHSACEGSAISHATNTTFSARKAHSLVVSVDHEASPSSRRLYPADV